MPDFSHFTDENRKRMQLFKYLNMYNEHEHFYNQEAESKFKFKNVTYDDILESINKLESEAQTIKDVQYLCKMRMKLDRIKYQGMFDDLNAKIQALKAW